MSKTVSVAVVGLFAAVCVWAVLHAGQEPPTPQVSSAVPPAPKASPVPSGPPPVEVLFASSDGKKEWVNDVVKAFNDQKLEVDGQVVVVKVEHMRSGESRQAILSGKSKPTIWGPAGKSWVDLINQDFELKEHHPLLPTTKDTVNVALVVAMWEPMATALGWPQKEVGWEDLHRVITNPKGWAAYGHPEWGAFKFGHSHPDASNSAMLSVVSMMYAGAHKERGLTATDMRSPRVHGLVEDIERSIVHYGESSSWLTDKLCARGPGYLSAVTVYESSVVKVNDKCTTKPFKLVALYPKDGTFWETHPAGVVHADWVTPTQAKAAEKFLAFLTSVEQQRKAPKYGYRPASLEAPLTAPFDEAHGVQPRATRRELEYVSEDLFQLANAVWHETKKKASVWVLLDTSGSMGGAPLEAAKSGTIKFLKKMERDDLVRVISFNTGIAPLNERGRLRDQSEVLTQRVSGLYAEGQTSLNDALAMALREVQTARETDLEKRTYSIVLLSDGADTHSRMSSADIYTLLPRLEDSDGTRVFTIAYGSEADESYLKGLAERSNAVAVKGSSADLDKLYQQLAAYF